ncbi:MAG TPA: aminodeoxychorismate synthase component I [Rhodocyclaceae bacterium]|nr:aminodeoxychorismate synthase component I [Rhodocyclaceae bacterium]
MHARIDFPLPDGQRLRARFGAPRQVLRAERLDQVAAVLAAAERAALAGHWVLGYVSYEAAPAFDPALMVRPADTQPLALFAVYETALDAAHVAASRPAAADAADAADSAPPLNSGHSPPAPAALPGFFCSHWASSLSPAAAAERIAAIQAGIAEGDYYQINLTMRATSRFSGSPEAFFEALTAGQPGAYAAYFDWGDGQLLSVSPELFFQRAGRTLSTRPMKGTAPRHADPQADAAAAEGLRHSVKERAENLMIVDLLRNDLARIAETGSVKVDRLFEVEPWPTVWQMTSTISASARPGVGLGELFAALFPCGSVTGAPKVAAMAGIAQLEDAPRGIYCGAIGVLQPGGDAVFSVGIRSVTLADGQASCGLGSAITIDSTAAGEYAEWMAKRRFLLRASAAFELLETLRLDIGPGDDGRLGSARDQKRQGGGYQRLEAHLQRLLNSAAWFGFAADETRVRAALAQTAAEQAAALQAAAQAATAQAAATRPAAHPPSRPDGVRAAAPTPAFRVRLLLARDGAVRCEAFPLEVPPPEVLVRLAARPIAGDPELLRHKTTERSAYAAFADLPAGLFDTLLYNARGELTEFTRGSVFLEEDGVLLTPPLSCGLLPGVLRAELLASGRAREAVLTREWLASGGRLWFGNSLRGLIPARLVEV